MTSPRRAVWSPSTPSFTAVTLDADLPQAEHAGRGSASQPSLLEIQAAVDQAATQLAEAVSASERLAFDMSRLDNERHDAQQRVDVALAKLHESDATLAAVAEELASSARRLARAARSEADRLTRAIEEAEAAREQDQSGLAGGLEGRLARAEADPAAEPELDAREQLVEMAREARTTETEARLALRTSEERARALHGRADQLQRAAQAEREPPARAPRSGWRARAWAAEAVLVGARVVLAPSRPRWNRPPRHAPPSSRRVRAASSSCSPSGRRCAAHP